MPGPAPKHPSTRARRNNPKAGFESLPATGRSGSVPSWPLLPDPVMLAEKEVSESRICDLQVEIESAEDGRTKGRLRRQLAQAEMSVAVLGLKIEQGRDSEVALWGLLWADPQAVMWDSSVAFQRSVALFVRWQIRAEQGDLKAAPEARMMSDRLGLNPLALQKLRAEIEHAAEAEDRGKRRRAAPGAGVVAAKRRGDGDDDPRSVLSVVT